MLRFGISLFKRVFDLQDSLLDAGMLDVIFQFFSLLLGKTVQRINVFPYPLNLVTMGLLGIKWCLLLIHCSHNTTAVVSLLRKETDFIQHQRAELAHPDG